MTPEDRAALEEALGDPAQKANHGRIRAALQKAQTHQPGEGNKQLDFVPGPAPRESFSDRISAMGRGVQALGSTALHPIDTFSSPEKTRQLARGALDVTTLGYGTKLADEMHARLPAGFPGNASAAGRRPFAETEASDAEAAPDYRTAGSIPAMFAPNPANLLFRGAGAVVGRGFNKVPVGSAAAGAPMGAAKSIVSYEATAPFMAGAHADSSGRRLEAAKEAAIDPLGLMLSGTLGAAGGAGRGNAARIRDPKTETGRVLETVRERGGPGARINMFGEPVTGGIFESPDMKSVSTGRRGTGDLAERQTTRIDTANTNRLREARAQYGDAVDDVIASHGDRPHPTPNAHKALDAMDADNTVNGVIGDEGVARATDKVRRMLTQQGVDTNEQATLANVMRKTGIPETARLNPQAIKALLAQAGPEDIVATPRQQATAGDMVKTRKIVRQLANNAPTPSENRVYQVILGAMDEDAALVDPRIREMNANFRKAMEPIEQSNEILFGKKGRDPGLSEAQRRTGDANFMRMGEETQAGIVREPAFQRLEQLGPEYRDASSMMRAKVAQEKLRRGDPETSTSLPHELARAFRRGGGPAAAGAIIGGKLAGPVGAAVGTAAGVGVGAYRANPVANRIRIGLPASEAVGKLSGRSAVGVDQITGIARNRGKKKRKQEEATP